MSEALQQAIDSPDSSGTARMLLHGEVDDEVVGKSTSSPQHVARQDSGVPEDMASPKNESAEEDPDGTMNSDCNITVIHVTSDSGEKIEDIESIAREARENEASPLHTTPESKDSKDGSDSGVEGCIGETPRVQRNLDINFLSKLFLYTSWKVVLSNFQ